MFKCITVIERARLKKRHPLSPYPALPKLQCVAASGSVLQCVAVRCSVLRS